MKNSIKINNGMFVEAGIIIDSKKQWQIQQDDNQQNSIVKETKIIPFLQK
jgi:hypothetical protein